MSARKGTASAQLGSNEAGGRLKRSANDEEPELSACGSGEGAAVLKAAKLMCRGEDELCLIRKIGRNWLVAEIYADIPTGEKVVLMLTDGVGIAGTVTWVGGARIKIVLADDADAGALLAASRAAQDGRLPRMPRIEVDCWARFRVGARVFSVRLADISQGGAKIWVHGLQTAGQQAVLTIRNLPPMPVVIRWSRDCRAGLRFHQTLGFAELAAWLEQHRAAAQAGNPSPCTAFAGSGALQPQVGSRPARAM